MIKEINKRIQNKRVLHIGAIGSEGSKKLMKRHNMYKNAAAKIFGIDVNRKLVNKVREEGNVEIAFSDITNNKHVDNVIKNIGTFDHIVMTEVIEHIGNLTLCCDNLYRLLNKGGELYISTPNALSAKWFSKQYNNRDNNPDHICWFDKNTITELLRRSNLKVIDVKYFGDCSKISKEMNIKHKEWMNKTLFVVAIK